MGTTTHMGRFFMKRQVIQPQYFSRCDGHYSPKPQDSPPFDGPKIFVRYLAPSSAFRRCGAVGGVLVLFGNSADRPKT